LKSEIRKCKLDCNGIAPVGVHFARHPIILKRTTMKCCSRNILALFVLLSLAPLSAMAHHSIAAKFDDAKPLSLNGTVTMLDWKNPHVHVFMNVQRAGAIERWAIELESRVDLVRNGWT